MFRDFRSLITVSFHHNVGLPLSLGRFPSIFISTPAPDVLYSSLLLTFPITCIRCSEKYYTLALRLLSRNTPFTLYCTHITPVIVSPCCVVCHKPGVHTNDFAPILGRPARIHTAPAESTVDSTYCLPQALCEYARGDRESGQNR